MKRSLVIASVLFLWPAETLAADEDPWLSPDKAVHFGVSAALAAGAYGVSALFLDQLWQRAAAAATFSLTLGASKELYDLSGHGDASWKDFAWDGAGTAVGVGVAVLVDSALTRKSEARETPSASAGAPLFIRVRF